MLARTGLSRRVPNRFRISTKLPTGAGNASSPGNGGNGIRTGGSGEGPGPSLAIGSLIAGCPSSRHSSADSRLRPSHWSGRKRRGCCGLRQARHCPGRSRPKGRVGMAVSAAAQVGCAELALRRRSCRRRKAGATSPRPNEAHPGSSRDGARSKLTTSTPSTRRISANSSAMTPVPEASAIAGTGSLIAGPPPWRCPALLLAPGVGTAWFRRPPADSSTETARAGSPRRLPS
jgi:hypothetical protein